MAATDTGTCDPAGYISCRGCGGTGGLNTPQEGALSPVYRTFTPGGAGPGVQSHYSERLGPPKQWPLHPSAEAGGKTSTVIGRANTEAQLEPLTPVSYGSRMRTLPKGL